jgi:hypothetical protein
VNARFTLFRILRAVYYQSDCYIYVKKRTIYYSHIVFEGKISAYWLLSKTSYGNIEAKNRFNNKTLPLYIVDVDSVGHSCMKEESLEPG